MPSAPAPLVLHVDRLDQLLAPPRSVESELASLLQRLYDRRYTGEITVHFKEGVAKVVTLPAPQIRLT